MAQYRFSRKYLGVTIVRPIFLTSVFSELITYVFLLCFDLEQLHSRVLYTSLIANALFVIVGVLAIIGTLRYIKRLLLLYSIWCMLHIIWIALCLLTSLHMIKLSNPSSAQLVPNSGGIPSEVLSDIAQWILSTPIPYGYSMCWQVGHSLKIGAHTAVIIMLAWQLVIVTTSGIFAQLVRRAYLAEQRNWDGLDNWAI